MTAKTFTLMPHPHTPPTDARVVTVELLPAPHDLRMTYTVEPAHNLVLPACRPAERADDLWRTTCFELFLRSDGDDGYFEFNFSPSTCWAAYRFDGYRAGMREMPLAAPPQVALSISGKSCVAHVDLKFGAASPIVALHLGLTAVIEEIGGAKSYWALAHAPGPPDFHNRDCFIATLAAPERP